MEQELVTLSEHLSSPSVFSGVSVTKYLILCCGLQIFVCHFVLYLFAIAVSLVFCVVVCRSLFVISSFIFLPLQCLQFCVVVCRSLFVILSFIFLPLQCLQFFVQWFVDLCLSFCPLSFCHCSVFSFLCCGLQIFVCHFVLYLFAIVLSLVLCCGLQIFVCHFVLYLFAIVVSLVLCSGLQIFVCQFVLYLFAIVVSLVLCCSLQIFVCHFVLYLFAIVVSLILCSDLQIFVCHFVLYLFAIVVSLVLCVVICRSLFGISSFIFLPLYCLSFVLRHLITSLVSSNFA